MEESVKQIVRKTSTNHHLHHAFHGGGVMPTSCYGYTNFGHDFDDDDDNNDGALVQTNGDGYVPNSSTYEYVQVENPEDEEQEDDEEDDEDEEEDEYGDGAYSDFSVEELHEFMLQQQQQSLLEYACSARRYSLLETIEEETVDEVIKSTMSTSSDGGDSVRSSEYSGVWCWGDDFTDGAESVIYVDNSDVDVEQEDRELDEFEEEQIGTMSNCCWNVGVGGAASALGDGWTSKNVDVHVIESDDSSSWSSDSQTNVIQDPSDREGSWLDSIPSEEYDPSTEQTTTTTTTSDVHPELGVDQTGSDHNPRPETNQRETRPAVMIQQSVPEVLPRTANTCNDSQTMLTCKKASLHFVSGDDVTVPTNVSKVTWIEDDDDDGDQEGGGGSIADDTSRHFGSDRDLLIVFDTEEADEDDEEDEAEVERSTNGSEYGSWSDAIDAYLMSLAAQGMDRENQDDQARLVQIKDYLMMMEETRRSAGVGSSADDADGGCDNDDDDDDDDVASPSRKKSRSRRSILGVDLLSAIADDVAEANRAAAMNQLPVVSQIESPSSPSAGDVLPVDFDNSMEERTDGDGAEEEIVFSTSFSCFKALAPILENCDDQEEKALRRRRRKWSRRRRLLGTKSAPDLFDVLNGDVMGRGRRGENHTDDDLDMFNSHHPYVAYASSSSDNDYATRSQSEPCVKSLVVTGSGDRNDSDASPTSPAKRKSGATGSFNFVFGGDLLSDNRRKSFAFGDQYSTSGAGHRRRSMYSFSSKSFDSQFTTSSEDDEYEYENDERGNSSSSDEQEQEEEEQEDYDDEEDDTGSLSMRRTKSLFPRFTPPGTLRSFRSFDSLNLAGRSDCDDYDDVTSAAVHIEQLAVEQTKSVAVGCTGSHGHPTPAAASTIPWIMDGIEEEESSDPEVEKIRPSSEDLSEDSGCCDMRGSNGALSKTGRASTGAVEALQTSAAVAISETGSGCELHVMAARVAAEAKEVVAEAVWPTEDKDKVGQFYGWQTPKAEATEMRVIAAGQMQTTVPPNKQEQQKQRMSEHDHHQQQHQVIKTETGASCNGEHPSSPPSSTTRELFLLENNENRCSLDVDKSDRKSSSTANNSRQTTVEEGQLAEHKHEQQKQHVFSETSSSSERLPGDVISNKKREVSPLHEEVNEDQSEVERELGSIYTETTSSRVKNHHHHPPSPPPLPLLASQSQNSAKNEWECGVRLQTESLLLLHLALPPRSSANSRNVSENIIQQPEVRFSSSGDDEPSSTRSGEESAAEKEAFQLRPEVSPAKQLLRELAREVGTVPTAGATELIGLEASNTCHNTTAAAGATVLVLSSADKVTRNPSAESSQQCRRSSENESESERRLENVKRFSKTGETYSGGVVDSSGAILKVDSCATVPPPSCSSQLQQSESESTSTAATASSPTLASNGNESNNTCSNSDEKLGETIVIEVGAESESEFADGINDTRRVQSVNRLESGATPETSEEEQKEKEDVLHDQQHQESLEKKGALGKSASVVVASFRNTHSNEIINSGSICWPPRDAAAGANNRGAELMEEEEAINSKRVSECNIASSLEQRRRRRPTLPPPPPPPPPSERVKPHSVLEQSAVEIATPDSKQLRTLASSERLQIFEASSEQLAASVASEELRIFGASSEQLQTFGTSSKQLQTFGTSKQLQTFGTSSEQLQTFGTSSEQLQTFGASSEQVGNSANDGQERVEENFVASEERLQTFGDEEGETLASNRCDMEERSKKSGESRPWTSKRCPSDEQKIVNNSKNGAHVHLHVRTIEQGGPFRTIVTDVNRQKNVAAGKPPLPPRQVAPCRSKIIDARLQFFNRDGGGGGANDVTQVMNNDSSSSSNEVNTSLERFRQRAREGIERAAKSVFDLQKIESAFRKHSLEASPASNGATVDDIDPPIIPQYDADDYDDDDDEENSSDSRSSINVVYEEHKNGGHDVLNEKNEQNAQSFAKGKTAVHDYDGGGEEEEETTRKIFGNKRSPSIGYLETDIDTLHSREVILLIASDVDKQQQQQQTSSRRHKNRPSSSNKNLKARSMFNLSEVVNGKNDLQNDDDDDDGGGIVIINGGGGKKLTASEAAAATKEISTEQQLLKEDLLFTSGSPSSSSRAKSMEFLLKDEDKATILPPENQLKQQHVVGGGSSEGSGSCHLSEHELRFRRSLQKLNLPEWYKNSPLAKPGSTEGLLLLKRDRLQRRNQDSGTRWEDLRSRSTSVTSLGGGGGGNQTTTPSSSSSNRGVVIHKRVTTPDWRYVKSSRESLLQSPMSPSLPPSPNTDKSSYFQYYYNSTGISRWSSSRLSSTTAGSSRSTSPTGSAATAPAQISRSPFQRQPYLGWRSSERLSREKMMMTTTPPIAIDGDDVAGGSSSSSTFYRSAAERLSQGPGYYAMRFGSSGAGFRTAKTSGSAVGSKGDLGSSSSSSVTGSRPEITVNVYEPEVLQHQHQQEREGSPPEHVRVAAELSREIDKMISRGNGVDKDDDQEEEEEDRKSKSSAIECGGADLSPKSKRVWMESSFVGVRPIRRPTDAAAAAADDENANDKKSVTTVTAAQPSPWRQHSDAPFSSDDVNHHHSPSPPIKPHKKSSSSVINEEPSGGGGGGGYLPDRRLSLTSTTLEEVLDSLLALPSSSQSPSPSGYQRTTSRWEAPAAQPPPSKPAGPVHAPHNGTMDDDVIPYARTQPSAPPCPEEEDEDEDEEEEQVELPPSKPSEMIVARGSITSNGSSQLTSNSSGASSGSVSRNSIGTATTSHRQASIEGSCGGGSSDLTTATTVGSSVSSLSAELATNASSSSSSSVTTSGGSSTSGSSAAVVVVVAPPPDFTDAHSLQQEPTSGVVMSQKPRAFSPLREQVQQESVDFGDADDDDDDEENDVADEGFPPPPTQEDIFPEAEVQSGAIEEEQDDDDDDEDGKLDEQMAAAASEEPELEVRERRFSRLDHQMMDDTVLVRCSYHKCTSTAELRDARRTYKTCHNCYTYYCSRECRKSHWDKHRHVCMYGRIRAMCKQAIMCARDNPDFLTHLSRLARTGHLTHGPGFVKIVFRNTDLALHFLRHGWSQLEDGPIYVSWKDLLPQEMGTEVYRAVIDMCQRYEPETKFVLLASIFITREVPSMESVPHWEREVIAKCAKLSLAKSVACTAYCPSPPRQQQQQQSLLPMSDDCGGDGDATTLILTGPPRDASSSRRSAREACLADIDDRLRERGVSIRHQFPEVYGRLCSYVESAGAEEPFPPLTIYPKDGLTGQTFMCVIMPNQSSPPMHDRKSAKK